ncbi:MAG: ribonuclease J [Neomegalonema sp.]
MSERNELVYVALGGAGEIGMNCYLYGFGAGKSRRWIMVDCGVTFGDMASAPGVEIIVPDIDFISAERKRLAGIFITHAHEDHVGAIGRRWRRLRAPIYCTRFTAEVARRKLAEAGLSDADLTVVEPHQAVEAGPFECSFFPVTHSIPDANALVIRSPAGAVYHSGDFKFDPQPQIGPPTDLGALAKLGEEGVLALCCDSTNVFENGEAGSEESVKEGLRRAIASCDGAVAATTFASNVARLRNIAEIARENDRAVVVAGRAMQRMIEAAVESGAIPDFPHTISGDQAAETPSRHVLYLVTGSQGEGRAALGRIASDSHPFVDLGEGDLVIYSSSTIPGNEREVYRTYNRLAERGIRVIDADQEHVHVSGHGNRDELKQLHELLKPQITIPVHGEYRHLVEHARMALEWGAGASQVAPNGAMVRLAGGNTQPEIVEEIETGRVYVDGETHVGALDGVIRSRLKLARQGHVAITLVVDEEGELIADPEVRPVGAPEDGDGWPAPLDEMIAEAVDEALEKLSKKQRLSDEILEETASQACRRLCSKYWGKKPETTVIAVRLEEE